jgi:3-hydroxymyristoyl/3-hydroxydecanoyl-(acyl carrier protein) dehydratase
MTKVGSFAVAADHPCLPGHFPGRPVVPGVILLDEAMALLPPTSGLPQVKFLAVVTPGQTVEVGHDGRAFECSVGGIVVLRGQLAA